MKPESDYYAILQVDSQAEQDVIQAAYRRLAAKYHPDVDPSPGASERMKLLNAAYEILSNPEKRKAYDLYRAARWRRIIGMGSGPVDLTVLLFPDHATVH